MSDKQQAELVRALRAATRPAGPLALEGPQGALDIFLNFPADQQQALANLLLPQIDQGRERKRTQNGRKVAISALGMVVANALTTVGPNAPAGAVYYSRHNGGYRGRPPYEPPWLRTKSLRGIIDTMTNAGLLKGQITSGIPGSPRSTFWASPTLLDQLATAGISTANICVEQTAPVLLLRDSAGHLVSYDPDIPALAAASLGVRTYNQFIASQSLSLDASYEAMSSLLGPRRVALRRIYNEASWSLGGRFYGGWWQEVPKELRRFITINGAATVELDFEGFMPRAAYHLAGLDYRDDPYDIPAFRLACVADGITHNEGRNAVKTTFMWMLNAKSPQGLPKDVGDLILPSGMTVKTLRELIGTHHTAIAGSFFTAMSLTIMNRDSDVCARVLADGVRDNVAVLPIHDSFLVPEGHNDWLRDSMTRHYKAEFGFDPVIRLES